jgi:hypothetical protein
MLAIAAPSAFARATDGTISGVAGTVPGLAGDGGPATQARMNAPADVAFLTANSYLIADFNNSRIREVFPDGRINTVAGSDPGYFGDNGPAVDAGLDHPQGVTPLSGGAYLIADTFNHVIRKVDANGIITTIAGTDRGLGGDGGPATSAALSFPSDTAVMPDGSILVADTGNDRIRKIAPNGIITTVAGTTRGFGGDGGPATQAKLIQPRDVTVGSDGSILIADTGNSRVRRIDSSGTITTVAGLGAGLSGDGDPAAKANLNAPTSIVAAAHGGFIVADTLNNRIRRITPMGAIFTVAGTSSGNAGNGGLAKTAQLNQPGALTLDPNGGFLVADTANATIRRVSDIGAVPPARVGDSFGVAPSTGNVTIQPNGQRRFIRLQEEDLIPNFSQVDATNGEMDLTMARDAGGLQQTAHVFWSPFTVTQGTKGQPFTQFKIPPPDCGSTKATVAKTHKKKKKKRKQRRLWVSETGGNWKTATGSVSAGAIGTEWVTTSLCDGTRVTVRKGIVRVIDRKHRPHKVVLHAGDTFRTPTR